MITSKRQSFYSFAASRCVSGQSGLSLIELLIAMALGLLLTLGVTQIYLSGSQTYRQTQGMAHAQDSTRFVAAILRQELRSSGTFGCLAEMNRPLDQVIDNRLNGTPLFVPLAQSVQGWEFSGTEPGDSVTLSAAMNTPTAGNWASGPLGIALPTELAGSVVTNSDVIIVNALTPIGVSVNAVTPVSGNNIINLTGGAGVGSDRIVLATDENCYEGELFQKSDDATTATITMSGTSATPGNNGNQFNLTYGERTKAYEFAPVAYYIGEGTNDEPALFRRLMTPLQAPQELVSGVETLQILYGVDTNGNNAANNYLPANQVADWETVASVRFSVMTRSQNEVLVDANDRLFNMLGSEVAQASNGDRRARLVSASTTALRGRVQ